MRRSSGPCPPNMEVNHIDNDPGNSAVSNLFYGTDKQNIADAAKAGLFNRKLSHDDVRAIRTRGTINHCGNCS